MLAAKGIRNACQRYYASSQVSTARGLRCYISSKQSVPYRLSSMHPSRMTRASARSFTTSRCQLQETPIENETNNSEYIDKVVRDAKQRFRDTLPKDYLTPEEYALYVRLYGPPLRETTFEDVGIHMHADMAGMPTYRDNERTALLDLGDGTSAEFTFEIRNLEPGAMEESTQEELTELEEKLAEADEVVEDQGLTKKPPGYVEAVARNQREHDALQRLMEDFERSQEEQQEAEKLAENDEGGRSSELEEASWAAEEEQEDGYEEWEDDEPPQRFHPYTVEGSFHGRPIEILLPKHELVEPISDLLKRTHLEHVREAAETAYGGPGLPLTAETVSGKRNGNMTGIELLGDQKHMTEIEADAFLASFVPGAYASVFSILREVRRRIGGEWLQSRLKSGSGPSVLDAGSGGAGLVAWESILQAEWDLMREKGEVKGSEPPSKKTTIVPSDRLRNRLKTFLHNTTFLPRLPDYEHSGEMRGPRLDGGGTQQPRKSYDVIIASHLFLRETQSHHRQAVLNNLWQLLNKNGGILIVLEKAHPRGFEAVAHVRDTVINQFLLPQSGEARIAPEDFNPTYHREPEPGHVVAPCTNQGTCPMYKVQGKSVGRKDYCHFNQRFVRPKFYSKVLRKSSNNHGDVEFSYVAIQRGVSKGPNFDGKAATLAAHRGYENVEIQPDMQSLPRLIMPPLKRKGHITMDMCTPQGRLERWTVPKSFSKLAYHDARKSRWGDLWALGAKTRVEKSIRHGNPGDGTGRDAGGKKKKVRQVEVTVSGGRTIVSEKNGDGERRPRGKLRNRDAIEQLRRAEARDEEAFDEQIDEEIVAEIEEVAKGQQQQERP